MFEIIMLIINFLINGLGLYYGIGIVLFENKKSEKRFGILMLISSFIPLVNMVFLFVYCMSIWMEDYYLDPFNEKQQEYNEKKYCRACNFHFYLGNGLKLTGAGRKQVSCPACDSSSIFDYYGDESPTMKKITKLQAVKLFIYEQKLKQGNAKIKNNKFQQEQLAIYIEQQQKRLDKMKEKGLQE